MVQVRYTSLLLVTLLISPRVEARSCAVPDAIDAEFTKSSAVFLGRVTDKRVIRNSGGSPTTITTLQLIKSWKGPITRTLEVFSCGGEEVVCNPGFEFLIGQEFVVFATGDPLWVHGCDRTALISNARQTLRWLEGKRAQRLPNERVKPAA